MKNGINLNILQLVAVISLLALPNLALAMSATSPITVVNGVAACPTCVTGSSLTSNAVIIGAGSQGVSAISASTTTTQALFATATAPAFRAIVTGDLPSTVVLEADITAGTGLAVSSGNVSTDSTDQGFLASGALTCGASTNGKIQVHTTPLQYCDNAGTPTLQYAAYGASDGDATTTRALESASTTVNVSSATAPSTNQFLRATDSTHATWQTVATAATIVPFNSESQLDSPSTTTYYMGIGGKISTTEADVVSPVGAATFTNLRCYASTTVNGTSLVATLGVGACTGGLTYTGSTPCPGTSTCPNVQPASTTQVADTTNNAVTTAGQCIALKLVATGDTTAAFINCNIERTA